MAKEEKKPKKAKVTKQASESKPVEEPKEAKEAKPVKESKLEAEQAVPALNPGDTVSVHVRIREGDRERIQEFKGTVIRMRKGGVNANFTVRRIASNGIGVERTFLVQSPRIDKVVVERRTRVRRAQLYFLRGRTGKKSHLKQRFE